MRFLLKFQYVKYVRVDFKLICFYQCEFCPLAITQSNFQSMKLIAGAVCLSSWTTDCHFVVSLTGWFLVGWSNYFQVKFVALISQLDAYLWANLLTKDYSFILHHRFHLQHIILPQDFISFIHCASLLWPSECLTIVIIFNFTKLIRYFTKLNCYPCQLQFNGTTKLFSPLLLIKY